MPIKKIDYKWLVCLTCGFLSFCSIGFTAGIVSTYLPYMLSTANISRAMGGFVFTLRGVSAFTSLLLIDKYYRLFSLKKGLALAMLTGCASFVLYGASNSFGLYACAAVLSGIVHSFGGIIPITLMVERWFKQKRGLVLGIVSAFSGLTAIIMPPIFTLIAEKTSVKYSFFTEAFLFLLAAALALLIFKDPEGTDAANTPEFKKKASGGPIGGGKNAFSHLCLLAASFCISLISFGVLPNLSAYYVEAGFSSITVSFFVSVYGIFLTVFKVLHGRIADRYGGRIYAFASFPFIIACALIPILAAKTLHVPLALFGMVCAGMGYPLSTVGIVNFTRALTNCENYAAVLQKTQAFYAIGTIVGGYLIGKIADLAGSYTPAFLFLSSVGLLGFAAVLLALRRFQDE